MFNLNGIMRNANRQIIGFKLICRDGRWEVASEYVDDGEQADYSQVQYLNAIPARDEAKRRNNE